MKNFTQVTMVACLLCFCASGFAQESAATQSVVMLRSDSTLTTKTVDASMLKYSNKWRIKFDNRTDSAGELVFLFALQSKQPISIRVSVAKGLSENDIAKLVENAFKKYAPIGIKVERDDGEDVLLKYDSRFSLTLLTNTVTDLDVKLDKE